MALELPLLLITARVEPWISLNTYLIGPAVWLPHASTSTTRLYALSAPAFTATLTLLVVTLANENCRHTLLLPVTLPLDTVTHALPSQYCTSNAVMP